jgi:hypothetical protein
MTHLPGAGFKGGQLVLPVMKTALHRGPDVLVFGVGDARQGQQLAAGGLVGAQGAQHAADVNDAGQQAAVLDPAHLGLRHVAAAGQPLTGQAGSAPQVAQRAGETLAVMPCLLRVEFHASSFTYCA